MRFLFRSPFVCVLSLALTFLGAASHPVGAQTVAEMERAVTTMTNTYRGSKGLPGLGVDPALVRAAQKHVQKLAAREMISGDVHNVDGTTPFSRASAEGYLWEMVGENVQYNQGFGDPASAALTWWKGSPPHNGNMLKPGYKHFGVGAAKSASGRWFFVQVFGSPEKAPLDGRLPKVDDPDERGESMKKVEVTLVNKTRNEITFFLESSRIVMRPGHSGNYWYKKVGPVNFSYSYKLTGSPGAGSGAGILLNNQRYTFIQEGTVVRLQVSGR